MVDTHGSRVRHDWWCQCQSLTPSLPCCCVCVRMQVHDGSVGRRWWLSGEGWRRGRGRGKKHIRKACTTHGLLRLPLHTVGLCARSHASDDARVCVPDLFPPSTQLIMVGTADLASQSHTKISTTLRAPMHRLTSPLSSLSYYNTDIALCYTHTPEAHTVTQM